MRPLLVCLHRWLGVATALFLFVSGLTGAIVAWDHELDAMLNPSFFYAHTDGAALPSLELARRVEAADPRVEVTYLPLGVEPGHTQQMMVQPRTDPATGQPYAIGFNQLALDPATGEIQAHREWGAVSLARIDLLPFIYKLHYTLHLPFIGGFDLGTWLLGIVGIAWFFDSAIALALSFPSVKAWRKSFAFRVQRGGYALTFDLHRSGGVWIWGLLLMMALTSISMNLGEPVMRPIVSTLSKLAPTMLNNPELARSAEAGAVPLTREQVLVKAVVDGKAHGLRRRIRGGVFRAGPRSRRRGPRQRVALLQRQHGRAGRLEHSRPRLCRRHLHAGAIPAALGTHHRTSRTHSDQRGRRRGRGA